MQDAMMTYFDAEKNGGLLLAFIGVIALGVGLYLRTRPQVSALVTQYLAAIEARGARR